MPRRLLAIVLLIAALAAAVLYWRSDRRRIVACLEEAEEQVLKTGEEDQLTTFGKMRRLVGLFSPGFVVMASPYETSISDPQELSAVVAAYRSTVTQLRLVERRRDLAIDAQRGIASMALAIEVVTVDASGPGRRSFRFRIGWVRDQGEWRIHEVELLEGDEDGGGGR